MKTEMRKHYNDYIEKFKKATPDEIQEKMKKAIDELESSNDGEGLSAGEKAPYFNLPDAKGETVELYEQLKSGPVVLTFYRGGFNNQRNFF